MKIIFTLDPGLEKIAVVHMPCVPRVGERIWIDLDGSSDHTFIVKDIEYGFDVLYGVGGEVVYRSQGSDKNAEMELTQIQVLLSPTENSMELNHKILYDRND